MRAGMRSGVLLRETLLDMVNGTARIFLWILLSAALALPIAGSDLAVVSGQARAAAAFRDSGASVYVLTAKNAVDGQRCEALAQDSQAGSRGGALRALPAGQIDALPGTSIPMHEVTPGLAQLLAAGFGSEVASASPALGPSVLLGQEAADLLVPPAQRADLGSDRSPSVMINGTNARIAGEYGWPNDGRRAGLSYVALSPVPASGLFDECWVASWPSRSDISVTIRSVVSAQAPSGTEVSVTQLNTRLGEPRDFASDFGHRMTRANVALLGVVTVLLGWMSARLRRLEVASDLNAGVLKRDLLAKLLMHSLAWVLPSLAAIAAGGVALAWEMPVGDAGPLAVLAACYLLVALGGALAGTALGVAMVREKALAHYSKDRA